MATTVASSMPPSATTDLIQARLGDRYSIERATGRALVMDFGISRSIVATPPFAG